MTRLFPIENYLKEVQAGHHQEFPESGEYFSRYMTALGKLRQEYKKIPVAMAAEGLYTDHGEDHFDEVIRYLGELIPTKEVAPQGAIRPYELFLILMAARIHDVGNKAGREGHENRCFNTLQEIGDGTDSIERTIIASIAQAHGGRSQKGCKDTIGDIRQKGGYCSIEINARKCAALVRIADEICENRKRALQGMDFSSEKNKISEIFHVYASCISRNSFSPEDRQLTLEIDIPVELLGKKFPIMKENKKIDVLLIEEIASRLNKLNLERVYCNTYLPELLHIKRIKVTIRAYKVERDSNGIESPLRLIEITQHDFQDVGYPTQTEQLTTLWPEISPENFMGLVKSKTGFSVSAPN